ncbi:unnamed protein product [Rotaria sp. Silwood1]|nr:unnamed protein product [Rotaria sp. Silwood1]
MPTADISFYYLWSNEKLIQKEINHRRKVASFATGLALTTTTGVATFGMAIPLVGPIAAFKIYKIHSHRKKLKAVRSELARRHLSPAEKRKRDVLIPMTKSAVIYFATAGIADGLDLIPDGLQTLLDDPIQEAFELTEEKILKLADKFQAFIITEVGAAVIHKIMDDEYDKSHVVHDK